MKVNLKCFATLSEHDVCDWMDSVQHNISEGETVKSLIHRLGIPYDEIQIVFLNNKMVDLHATLSDGDNLGLAPAVGGM
jgi:molybdopterin converting factor small subunit